MKYYRFNRGKVDGIDAIVSRTGYTGEDGFEVYAPAAEGPRLFRNILRQGKEHGILPCGLGARDTLRLESKMALYGNDIDDSTTPLEADLGWIVKLEKGDFTDGTSCSGRSARASQRSSSVRDGDRGIARHGYPVVDGSQEIGVVTSERTLADIEKSIGLAYFRPARTERAQNSWCRSREGTEGPSRAYSVLPTSQVTLSSERSEGSQDA